MCVSARRRRTAAGLLLAAGASAVTALAADAAASSAPGSDARGAAVRVYAEADWYRARPEPQRRWTGVLRRREPVAGPAGRTALDFALATAGAEYPVYAAGHGDTLAPFVGRTVAVEGKLVDLAAEGFGKELWFATIRAVNAPRNAR